MSLSQENAVTRPQNEQPTQSASRLQFTDEQKRAFTKMLVNLAQRLDGREAHNEKH